MIWSGTVSCGSEAIQKTSPENYSPPLQIHGVFKKILKKFIDFLFPIFCVNCEKQGTHCCSECIIKISRNYKGEELHQTKISMLYAACPFSEKSILAELMHRYKYDSAKEICDFLLGLFPSPILEEIAKIPNKIYVPVPLFKRREWNRGFNQSTLIANGIKKIIGGEVIMLLKRIRYTKPQAQLTRDERKKNIASAFALSLHHNINRDANYFLVDDVYTTGATMHECAKELMESGIKNIFGIVIGRA